MPYLLTPHLIYGVSNQALVSFFAINSNDNQYRPQYPVPMNNRRTLLEIRSNPMKKMADKVCIVTGGGGSLGMESARCLLDEGARVMLVDNNPALLEAAEAALKGDGRPVATVTADVSDSRQVQEYIAKTVKNWGKVDLLFSNAGISGVIKPITEFPEEVFDQVMAVNVRSSFLACKYGIPQMHNGGSIIFTSSVVGVTSDPGICAYATSKHALIGLMRTVAKEVAGRGIRVNVICPGPVDNDFQGQVEEGLSDALGQNATDFLNQIIPLGRHANAVEIAKMVLFLGSDESSFSTGGIFMADGGMSI
jgi:NAD(P)-dependent dehydrogenase (short-subunit alcohol dehydrogenase family)